MASKVRDVELAARIRAMVRKGEMCGLSVYPRTDGTFEAIFRSAGPEKVVFATDKDPVEAILKAMKLPPRPVVPVEPLKDAPQQSVDFEDLLA